MREPGTPADEPDRLAALRRLEILDTPAEERFDRLTRISSRLFDVPIAAISLVARDRQWFKSTVGLAERETSRRISFCGHAILGDDVFEVRNSRRDPRFRNNPLVVNQPHIFFYAGAPLGLPNGHKLGTLCIIDRVPRFLDADEKSMLKDLADMVIDEILRYIDPETGLANRAAMMMAGTECFDVPPDQRTFSLLVFDLNEVASRHDTGPSCLPGEMFANLLRKHLPGSVAIAHMGANEFCALVPGDEEFDEQEAVARMLAEAEDFSVSQRRDFFCPLVGRIRFERGKHTSFDEMVREADGMFARHEIQFVDEPQMWAPFVDYLMRFRKTIY